MKNVFIALGESAQTQLKQFRLEYEREAEIKLPSVGYVSVMSEPAVLADGIQPVKIQSVSGVGNTIHFPKFDFKSALINLQKSPWMVEPRQYLEHYKNYINNFTPMMYLAIPKPLYRLHLLNQLQELLFTVEKTITKLNADGISDRVVIHLVADLNDSAIAACLADIVVHLRHIYESPYYSLQLYVDLPSTEALGYSAQRGRNAHAYACLQELYMLSEKKWLPENILGPLPLEVPKKWFDSCLLLSRLPEDNSVIDANEEEKQAQSALSNFLMRKCFGYESLLHDNDEQAKFYIYSLLNITLNRNSVSEAITEVTLQNILNFSKDWEYSAQETFSQHYELDYQRWYLSDEFLLSNVETPLEANHLSRTWENIEHDWLRHREKWMEDLESVAPEVRVEHLRQWYGHFYKSRFRLAGVKAFYDGQQEALPKMAKMIRSTIEKDLLGQWRSKTPLSIMPQAIQEILLFLKSRITAFNQELAKISQEVFESQNILKGMLDRPQQQFIKSSSNWRKSDVWRTFDEHLYLYYLGRTRQSAYYFAVNYLQLLFQEIRSLYLESENLIIAFHALHTKVNQQYHPTGLSRVQELNQNHGEFGSTMVSCAAAQKSLSVDFLKSLLHPAFIHALTQKFAANLRQVHHFSDLTQYLQASNVLYLIQQLAAEIDSEVKRRLQEENQHKNDSLKSLLSAKDLEKLKQNIVQFCHNIAQPAQLPGSKLNVFLPNIMYDFLDDEAVESALEALHDVSKGRTITEKQPNNFDVILMSPQPLRNWSGVDNLRESYHHIMTDRGVESGLFILQGSFHHLNWLTILSDGTVPPINYEKKRQILLWCYLLKWIHLYNDEYRLVFTNNLNLKLGKNWIDMLDSIDNDALWYSLYDRIQQHLRGMSEGSVEMLSEPRERLQVCIQEIKEACMAPSAPSQGNGSGSAFEKAGTYLPWTRAAKGILDALNRINQQQ